MHQCNIPYEGRDPITDCYACRYCPPYPREPLLRSTPRLPPLLSNNQLNLNPIYMNCRAALRPKNIIRKITATNRKRCAVCDDLTPSLRNKIMRLIAISKKKKLHFTPVEVGVLLQIFAHLTTDLSHGMTPNEFKTFLYATLGITNPFTLDGLIKVAIDDSEGTKNPISALEFVTILSTLLRGTINERSKLAFKVMDVDNDGFLKKKIEFHILTKDSFVTKLAAANPEVDPEEPAREITNYICEKLQCTINHPISLKEFQQVIRKKPELMECLLPCLPTELTNIVFQALYTTKIEIPSLIRDGMA